MERECLRYFDLIDDLGGVISALESGFFHNEIAEASWRYQQEIEARQRVIVGVNEYLMDDDTEVPTIRINEESFDRHMVRLNRVRADRDQQQVADALLALERACADPHTNVMPSLLDAVNAYATLGEMCDVLREEWGEYTPPTVV